MSTHNNPQPATELFKKLSKNSLIKVQYSCCGSSSSIDETNKYIPIVPDENQAFHPVEIRRATSKDMERLLQTDKSEYSLTGEECQWILAFSGTDLVGSIAIEFYPPNGIIHSVWVDEAYRGKGIGRQLLQEAEFIANQQGADTAFIFCNSVQALFFGELNWELTNRTALPPTISQNFTSRFSGASTCMYKTLPQ